MGHACPVRYSACRARYRPVWRYIGTAPGLLAVSVSVPARPNRQPFRFDPCRLRTELRRPVRAGTEVTRAPEPVALLILRLQHAGTLPQKGVIRMQVAPEA